MTMQHNIDILRRRFRRNMHEPKFQTRALKIDDDRPVGVPIAISAHNGERPTGRFEIEYDRRFANVTKMPDLIRFARKIDDLLRQLVVSVREHKYLHSTESRTTDTTGTKFATLNFVVTFVAFVRGLIPKYVI